MIRRAAEILLAGLRVKRRLPKASGGGLIVATAGVGGLKYIFRSAKKIDPILLSVTRRLVRPGDVVWDVGANLGFFSVAAAYHANRSGYIYAFEADIEAASLLLESARLGKSDVARISIVPIALAASGGFLNFNIAKRARSANSLTGFGSTQTGGIKEVRTVPSFSLDSLLDYFSAPQVLKIDVEGAEKLVLEGASNLLKTIRPAIFCEVNAENSAFISG